MTIPEEYADAARVDGAGELRVMLLVVARLAKPAIAAVALFAFLYAWNDFFGPLLYTGRERGALDAVGRASRSSTPSIRCSGT